MEPSLTAFRDQVRDKLLAFLWRQWSALGVAGHERTNDPWAIDPDALLLLTATVGRHDARLFDEVLDWLRVNGTFLNVQRLRRIQRTEGFAGLPVLAGIAGVIGRGADSVKWKNLAVVESGRSPEPLFFLPDYRPMPVLGEPDPIFARAGLLRDSARPRGYAQPFRPNERTALALQLRALVGVNARAEIIQYLLTHDAAHPAEIARQAYYFKKTVQDALVDMHRSGVVEVRSIGREKHYWLKPEPWARLLSRDDAERMPEWISWPSVFIALERIWLTLLDPTLAGLDANVLSVELRALLAEIRPAIERAGLPANSLSRRHYVGDEFVRAFLDDVQLLLGYLERPTV